MLYIDTHPVLFYLLVENLWLKINACLYLGNAFDLNNISLKHYSNFWRAGAKLHVWEINYFKYESNKSLIVKFVG